MTPVVYAAVGQLPPTWASQVLEAVLFVLAGAAATAVATCRVPVRQVALLSGYGIVLSFVFFSLQAPDVTLSEMTVGAIVLPLLLLLTLSKIKGQPREGRR